MKETIEENEDNIESDFPSGKNEPKRKGRAKIHSERPGEIMKFCQNCGKELEPGTNFCPVCGKPIRGTGDFQAQMPMPMSMPNQPSGQPPYFSQPQQQQPSNGYFRTSKPIVGGILIVIGAVWCLVMGLLCVLNLTIFSHSYSYYNDFNYWIDGEIWLAIIITIAVFEFWGFAIGLTGAVLTFKRTRFVIAIIGASFVIVGAGLAFLVYLPLAILILILGILGLIFIAISKNEFIPANRYPMSDYPPL